MTFILSFLWLYIQTQNCVSQAELGLVMQYKSHLPSCRTDTLFTIGIKCVTGNAKGCVCTSVRIGYPDVHYTSLKYIGV